MSERIDPDLPMPFQSYAGTVPVAWELLERAYTLLSGVNDLFEAEAEVAERRAVVPEGTTDRTGLWGRVYDVVQDLATVLSDWEDAQRKAATA